MTELNDELLVAYVDGQLAKDQSKAVERVLEEDEIAAQRVEALRAANAHLETAFEAMLAREPIPIPAAGADAASPAVFASRSVGTMVRQAALLAWVGAGCLLGGAAAGFIFYDRIAAEPVIAAPEPAAAKPASIVPAPAPLPASWADDVARTHGLLSPETFAFGLESEGNRDLASFHLSKALGANLAIPDLSGRDLNFHRAQLLQREGKPFAQVAYMAKSGVPVALYATAHSGRAEAMTLDEKNNIGLAAWTQGGLSLLLAGNLPDDRLKALAGEIESQLAAIEPTADDTGAPVESPVLPVLEEPKKPVKPVKAAKPKKSVTKKRAATPKPPPPSDVDSDATFADD